MIEILTLLLLQAIPISIVVTLFIEGSPLPKVIHRILYYVRYTETSVYEYEPLPVISCGKCISFWVYLILFWEPTIWILVGSSIASLLSLFITKYIILL